MPGIPASLPGQTAALGAGLLCCLNGGPVRSEIPAWLRQRLEAAGGSVPFSLYMEWVLHDPLHGAYGRGRLSIGREGDFVTSPSLGPDFALLLARQLIDWLEALPADREQRLSLVETGPGEGQLALDLALHIAAERPELASRLELVLVEPNPGMAERQRLRLQTCPLPRRWLSFAELADAPVTGVVLAHEVLDALAVERIVADGVLWRRQLVTLHGDSLRLEPGEILEPDLLAQLAALELPEPGPQRPTGWCSELHPGLEPWLRDCARSLRRGQLLVIDYGHEAWRFYAPQRANGTLMAYRAQQASDDPLQDPGHWDLTAHLCLESLELAAERAGWCSLGQCRQGQALLALGLAEQLHGLQRQQALGLDRLLQRREALLRLVDPGALGDFRWVAFGLGEPPEVECPPLFLREPLDC